MDESPRRWVRRVTALSLVLATLAVYAGVRHAQFITYDDPMYVAENVHVRGGVTWSAIAWALRSGYAANWHPLTWVSHMLDVELWAFDPRGHHATSLVLHAANSVLLLVVLERMTRAFWPSAMVAALFALHPTHVESVAWIAERKDVLSTFFLMLTLLAYRHYTQRPGRARYGLTLALFALGLMAKPMLVTLPFALLLLDYWPLERMRAGQLGRLVREKIPFFALALLASIATFVAQKSSGAVASVKVVDTPTRLSNALLSYVRYIAKTLWPTDLAIYYPHTNRLQPALAAGALALLALITWFAVRERVRRPYLVCGWLWYLGTLVPVIGLVQVGSQAMADRYTYIPSIGLYVAAVWSAREWISQRASIAVSVATAILLALALTTRHQVEYWRNTRALFGHTLAITTDNAVANQCYGYSLLLDGETADAIGYLREALRLSPDFPDAHNNLGTALGSQGHVEEAIEQFHAALRTEPENSKTHYNLAFALGNAGRFAEALPEYQESLRLDPDQVEAHHKLALALGALGRIDEMVEHLRAALALRPGDVELCREIAVARIRQGKVEEGIAAYRELLRVDANDLDALNNIAWIRATHASAEHRNPVEAVQLAERARDLASQENAILFDTLAAAYASANRYDDAVKACEKAIALSDPKSSDAERFRGHLELFRAGKPFFNL